MFWKRSFLLLLLLHIAICSKGKRRIRKRDDNSPDPLLAEIFKSTENNAKPKEEVRSDRSLDPGEELEAILTGFKNKNKHLLPVEGPVKRDSGLGPVQNGLDQQNLMVNLYGDQNPVARDNIPTPDGNMFQVPGANNAAENQDLGQNLMQLPQVNGNPAANFMQLEENLEKKKDQIQVKNYIPGRPNQRQNDWGNQPGVTVYLHQDKKSSIPIPVKTGAAAVQNPGSFPLQMRKISPNMNIGSVVAHHAEYGETVESVLKKPEEVIAKKSEIPHADSPAKADKPAEDAKKETVAKPEAAKTGDSSKKDFLQQPLMMQQQQQQSAAFQTMSQFGTAQGGQNAAFQTLAAPAPAAMAQPAAAAAAAPAAIPGEPCNDQYDTCADFAKNDYCVKYPVQMSTQCRKSCKFCVAPETPAVDSKQQIATAAQGAPGNTVAQAQPQGSAAQAVQGAQVPQKAPISDDDSSGSGSGDSSGSGDAPQDVTAKRSEKPSSNNMFLPELGSGSESGSGSGDSFASGSEAAVVRQLASAQNIVSGVGLSAAKQMNNTKKSFIPLMKNALKARQGVSSAIVKKSNIPQRPVSPLTAMDAENVNNADEDDDDAASASGSGSGSGEDFTSQQIETKSKIPKAAKKQVKARKSDNKKKSEIPQKPAAAPAVPQISSAYPRIDLRKIASALANYEEAALTLAGEYPRVTATDTDLVTRSRIPRPGRFLSPFQKLRQNIQIAKLVTQEDHKRFEIPKYLLVGDQITEKDGIAKDSSLPSADSYESVMQRFNVPGVKPSIQDLYAETGKPVFESEAAKRMRISRKKKKKIQKPVDPFEYLRNMPAGASMEPIIDPHSVSSTRQSVSYPVYLMKVMPGSHKYVAASTRSKVNSIPKKGDAKSKAPVAPSAPSAAAAPIVTSIEEPAPNPAPAFADNTKPEFETGPGPENDAPFASEPLPDVNAIPDTEIQLGPPKEQPAPQNVAAQQVAAMEQPKQNMVENMKQERPSLRTKMLSAFFHKKKTNDEGSGSGEGEAFTRDMIWGTGGLIPEQPMMMPAQK